MSELAGKKIGDVDLKLEFVDKKLKLSSVYDGNGIDGGAFVSLEPGVFLDKLKAAIPGPYDDAIIEALKAAFDLKTEEPAKAEEVAKLEEAPKSEESSKSEEPAKA